MYKYEIMKEIGRGTWGTVHLARRIEDNLILCCKRLDCKYLQLAEAEFKVLRSFRHPNIVAAHEIIKVGDHVDLYIEYCGGGDLRNLIETWKNRALIPESLIWGILSQLLSALYCCHYRVHPPDVAPNMSSFPSSTRVGGKRLPILHRDIKPDNIFLDDKGNVKLGDFGLCKQMTGNFTTSCAGTPLYMAPEMISTGGFSPCYTLASDIWAVGCTMYELCLGEPPFGGKNSTELFNKIRNGKLRPLPREYSYGLKYIIKSCLHVTPKDRPSTAELFSLINISLTRNAIKTATNIETVHRQETMARQKEASLRQKTEIARRQEFKAMERDLRQKYQIQAAKMVQEERDRLKAEYQHNLQEITRKLEKRPSEKRSTKAEILSIPTYDSSGTSSASESDHPPGTRVGPVKVLIPKRRLPYRVES